MPRTLGRVVRKAIAGRMMLTLSRRRRFETFLYDITSHDAAEHDFNGDNVGLHSRSRRRDDLSCRRPEHFGGLRLNSRLWRSDHGRSRPGTHRAGSRAANLAIGNGRTDSGRDLFHGFTRASRSPFR